MRIIRSLLVLNVCALFSMNLFAQDINIDNFENLNSWQKVVSDGASMNVSLVKGVTGNAIKIDYKFTGAGYCGIVKNLSINLPSNYKFTFYCKANSPKNNLEFKLDDSTGNNVWWYVFRRFDFPKNWTLLTVRKRQIAFAWGPRGGGELKHLRKIELIISAAAGGSGTVYLDELSFKELPPPETKIITPTVKASSSLKSEPSFIFDKNPKTEWRSGSNEKQSLLINFKYLKEYGGIIINWDSLDYATNYNIESSDNLKSWKTLYTAKNDHRKISFIPLPDNESNYMRINLIKSSRGKGYGIKGIDIENYKFAEDDNYRFEQIAGYYPKGYFPKYFLNKQTYWTLVGINGGEKKGLINEEGMIETSKESFSVEPFLYYNNKFITWNSVKLQQGLERNYLPIPNVNWLSKDFKLEVQAFGAGKIDSSSMYIKYSITNTSAKTIESSLFLAIRPFQVNPPWQNLNTTGGAAKINSIEYKDGTVNVNDKKIVSVTKPSNFGASMFSNGSIVNYISRNSLPKNFAVKDSDGFASSAFQYSFKIEPGKTYSAVLIIPFDKKYQVDLKSNSALTLYDSKLKEITHEWIEKLDKVQINLPASENKLVNTLKSNLAYILINRSDNALQPGPRCYDRSWIRDGSLMSAALLRFGITKEVKNYINWYSKYQFPSGKIPCVVDRVGADPVPENDSQGEYIFLLLQYFKFTKDTSMLKSKWENIKATVNYIKYQISEESTAKYKNGTNEQKSFYGLVPASISHEGYVQPMHSYWDDFFVILGLKDAVVISKILGMKKEENEYKKLRDTFRTNLYNSMRLAMKNTGVNYIPGCAELGDFDATSTAIGIFPCDELKNIPEPQLHNTFNKYYSFFKKRLNPDDNWINYTPYEIRVAGTFIYLNEIKRTYNLLNFFFKGQRPEGWNEWAEVVWKDKNTPKFIGDMPHTWVGSGYINTVRALFVYEKVSSLVLGAGIRSEWLKNNNPISFDNFPTYYGTISYSMKQQNGNLNIRISGNVKLKKDKIILISPIKKKIKGIIINGKPSSSFDKDRVYLSKSNAEVKIEFQK